jgi:hypothetical protein
VSDLQAIADRVENAVRIPHINAEAAGREEPGKGHRGGRASLLVTYRALHMSYCYHPR